MVSSITVFAPIFKRSFVIMALVSSLGPASVVSGTETAAYTAAAERASMASSSNQTKLMNRISRRPFSLLDSSKRDSTKNHFRN